MFLDNCSFPDVEKAVTLWSSTLNAGGRGGGGSTAGSGAGTAVSIAEISFFGRATIGLILFLAAAAKLLEPMSSRTATVLGYGFLKYAKARLIARLLPFFEIVLGVGLLFDRLMPWPALFAAGLFGVFSIAMTANLLRGRRVPCGCFGGDENALIGWHRVGINPLLATVAVCSALPILVRSWIPRWNDLSVEDAIPVFTSAVGTFALSFLARALINLKALRRMAEDGGGLEP